MLACRLCMEATLRAYMLACMLCMEATLKDCVVYGGYIEGSYAYL